MNDLINAENSLSFNSISFLKVILKNEKGAAKVQDDLKWSDGI